MRLPFEVLQAIYAANNDMNYQPKTITFEKLYKGLIKCRRGVRWKDGVAVYSANALKNTYRLKQDLDNKRYKIKPYRYFVVTDPKRRDVMATSIRDRQFQRALCDNYLYHEITRHFIYDNCACQKNKGTDFALRRMKAHLQKYYRKHGSEGWVLKCDIHHFFAETPHEIAKTAVRKRVRDDTVFKYVCQIIDSFSGDKGIGLGSQVSQLVQLAVLDDLDHHIKERLRIEHYVRYMDDFVLIYPDKDYLKKCLEVIKEKLSEIGLSLNAKTQLFPIRQGIQWLKWRYILTNSGKVLMTPDAGKIKREKRKRIKLLKLYEENKITIKQIKEHSDSWAASVKKFCPSLSMLLESRYKNGNNHQS